MPGFSVSQNIATYLRLLEVDKSKLTAKRVWKSQRWSFSYSLEEKLLKTTNVALRQRVYYTLAVWRFKPFLSVGWQVHSYLSGGLRSRNYRRFRSRGKRSKNESSLQSRKNKLWRFAECATPFRRPSSSRHFTSG